VSALEAADELRSSSMRRRRRRRIIWYRLLSFASSYNMRLYTKGLVTRARAEKEMDMAFHKLPYAHDDMPDCASLAEAVRLIKPTALIGIRRHDRTFTG